MVVVTSLDVETVLRRWGNGELSLLQVHTWAEERFAVDACEAESAATNEVLAQLDMMDVNLTTTEDIPRLIAVLHADDHVAALETLSRSINIEQRRQELQDNPFYARFCK